MRAALLPAFGADFVLTEVDAPKPGAGEVSLDVVACGAGLTLEHMRNGLMGGKPPMIMGHEIGGRIAQVGPGVSGWEIGDRVTTHFYLTCGACDMCVNGHESLCRKFRGLVGAVTQGAFADQVVLPARNLVRAPDNVGLDVAGIVADAIATPYHVAKDRIRIGAGDRIAVIGAGGGLGVHTLGVARAFGAIVIGVERDQAKLEALERGGHADVLVDSSQPNWREALARASGTGLTAVIDTVVTTETMSAGADALGARGALVILGIGPKAEIKATPNSLMLKEAAIIGTRYCNRAEIAESLALVSQGRVQPVIGARFDLTEINAAFEAIRASTVFGRVVVEVARE
jgi:propanol-preferring alcohol dehydrogenase